MKDLHYAWMVDYTPQREWIEGMGKALWLAFFFSEIGAGLYFVSLFSGQVPGLIFGWLLSVPVGGSLHLTYLGHPMKAWRAVLRLGTSELSRGMIITVLFGAFGALQLAPMLPLLSGLPWDLDTTFFTPVMGILSVLVMMHGFMTLSSISALPFWNTATLVVLSVTSGIWVGSQLATGTALFFGDAGQLSSLETWGRGFLLAHLFVISAFIWDSAHGNETKKASLNRLFHGRLSLLFCAVGLGLGLAVPLIITLDGIYHALNKGLLVVRLTSALVGDAALRYGILRAGLYTPLVPR